MAPKIIAIANRMVLAIHPERIYDYQYTKPLPVQTYVEETPLKELKKDIFTDSPNLEQLQALTYTPRRYWNEYIGKAKRINYRNYFDQKKDVPPFIANK